MRFFSSIAFLLFLSGQLLGQGPLLISQEPQSAEFEVIRPIENKLEAGRMARLKTLGNTKWTIYEPGDLQVVIESDRSLLFTAPLVQGKIIIFAAVQSAEGPPIFQPFVIAVSGATPPGPGPDPDPQPDPSPVPDQVPNAEGLGGVSYMSAMAVKGITRKDDATRIAKVFSDSAVAFGEGRTTAALFWTPLWQECRQVYVSDPDGWKQWEAAVAGAIRNWRKQKVNPSPLDWNVALTEIARAMELVK